MGLALILMIIIMVFNLQISYPIANYNTIHRKRCDTISKGDVKNGLVNPDQSGSEFISDRIRILHTTK